MITNGSAQVVSSNLYDRFGVLRDEQGSAQTPDSLAISPSRRHVVVNGVMRGLDEGIMVGELKQNVL